MSIDFMASVWKLEMKPTQKFILLCLADNANDEGMCYPSLANIQKKTGFGRRTVIEGLSVLEQQGYIVKEQRFNSSTIYTLTPRCRKCTPPVQEMHP